MAAAAETKEKTASNPETPAEDPFDGVHAYISRSLPDALRKRLTKLLAEKEVDLVHFDDAALTHFVTDSVPSEDSPEYVASRPGLHFVTPFWVERTVMLGTRQEPTFYSPHPSMLFSGVVATSCDLSLSDNVVMAAGISSLGGQWRKTLTKDVTHLFALSTRSQKYATAMHFKDQLPMKVLVPHWFDDTVRLGMRNIPTEPYEWPEPRVFSGYAATTAKALGGSTPADSDEDKDSRRGRPISIQKKALYDTVLTETSDLPTQRLASDNIWEGRKIMFGSNLEFTESQREAHYRDVERAGGEVVEWETPEEELEKMEEADIYICQYRNGRAFVKAYKQKKTIGNLHWFWYVRSTGIISRPEDQLLHYPIPRKSIEGFSRHLITVTNYTGKDREYLKKLLYILGVPYSPTMTSQNTAVIAANMKGDKTVKAEDWGVPIVNHTWLEDCFAQWRDIPTALPKYSVFPPGVDFGDLLADDGGRAGMGIGNGHGTAVNSIKVDGVVVRARVGFDQAELDLMEREIEAEAERLERGEDKENEGPRDEVRETPKKGILKRGKGVMNEDAATTSRRLAAMRVTQDDDDDVEMGGVVDASTGMYVDMDIALDDDGRLSMSGDDLGFDQDEDQMEVDDAERGRAKAGSSKAHASTPARPTASSVKRPGTPARPKVLAPSTPKSKATLPDQSRVTSKRKTRDGPLPPPESEEEEEGTDDDGPSSPLRLRQTPARPRGVARQDDSTDERSVAEVPRAGRPTTSRRAAMKDKSGRRSDTGADLDDLFATPGSSKKGTVIKTYGAKSRSRSRSRSRVRKAQEEKDSDEDSVVVKPARRGRPRTSELKGKARAVEDDDEEMEDVPTRTAPKRRTPSRSRAATGPSRRQIPIPSDTEEEEEQPKKRMKTPVRRASQASLADKTNDDESVDDLTDEPHRPRTPRRRASVVLPTLAEVRSSSQQRVDASPAKADAENPGSTKPKASSAKEQRATEQPAKRGRPASTRSAKQTSTKARAKPAASARVPSRSRPATPSTARKTKSTAEKAKAAPPARTPSPSPPPPAPTSKKAKTTVEKAKAAPPQRTPSPSPPPEPKPRAGRRSLGTAAAVEAGPSRAEKEPLSHRRRSAATKAAQKLHDEVMPDVVNFQKELKNGHVKSAYDEQAAKDKAKERDREAAKGKKRASVAEDEDEAAGDDDDERETKKRKTETGAALAAAKRKGRKSNTPAQEEEEEEDEQAVEEPKKRSRPAARTKSGAQAADDKAGGNGIVVMTTQVTLDDSVTKALIKLGVKFTTKASECTHLVARGIVRTEKFLCAMAVAPHIVTAKWAEKSASAKKIQPESLYLLKDPENEKRYKYKLDEALERAKQNGRRLFEGKTFYVTPKVPAEMKLLRAVVTAGGGQVLAQSPTLRILKGHDNRFVISCPEDVSIWRPLAEHGHTIYSQELILTAVLKQQIDWDDQSQMVPGSF